jgi:hypothetical protein
MPAIGIELCVLCEVAALGEEGDFVIGTDSVHCEVWAEAEKIVEH